MVSRLGAGIFFGVVKYLKTNIKHCLSPISFFLTEYFTRNNIFKKPSSSQTVEWIINYYEHYSMRCWVGKMEIVRGEYEGEGLPAFCLLKQPN